MKKNPEAFLFDLSGTMIDDIKYHLEVWFEVITKDLGADLTREELKSQMYGKNEEVLIRIFGESRFNQFNEFTTYNNVRLFIEDFLDPRLSTHLFIES